MKDLNLWLLIIICFPISCQPENDLSSTDLKNKITELNQQITSLTIQSSGASSNDCRTRYIGGGDNCTDPVFAYGIDNIDTLLLERLFEELSEAKMRLQKQINGSICEIEWIVPEKDSLIQGTCVACFLSNNSFNCY